MPLLQWKLGETGDEAKAVLQQQFAAAGYAGSVIWNSFTFGVSVGPWGAVLNLQGVVMSNGIALLNKCSGFAGAAALAKVRTMLTTAFPGGEIK